jgi:hypothetical protein
LTVVTFFVTVCLSSELKPNSEPKRSPDESDTKNRDEPGVPSEIAVDEGCSLSLPLQANKCIYAR